MSVNSTEIQLDFSTMAFFTAKLYEVAPSKHSLHKTNFSFFFLLRIKFIGKDNINDKITTIQIKADHDLCVFNNIFYLLSFLYLSRKNYSVYQFRSAEFFYPFEFVENAPMSLPDTFERIHITVKSGDFHNQKLPFKP